MHLCPTCPDGPPSHSKESVCSAHDTVCLSRNPCACSILLKLWASKEKYHFLLIVRFAFLAASLSSQGSSLQTLHRKPPCKLSHGTEVGVRQQSLVCSDQPGPYSCRGAQPLHLQIRGMKRPTLPLTPAPHSETLSYSHDWGQQAEAARKARVCLPSCSRI